MTVSQPKRDSIKKYQQEKCDRLTVDVPKGKRDAYKMIAAELGISLAMLIQISVETQAGKEFVPVSRTESISAEEKRLLENFARCPENVKTTLKKLIEQLAPLSNKGGDENGDN